MNDGWVKLWRKMKDNPLFGDSVWVHLTVYLVLEAAHKPKQVMFEGNIITLSPGQVITGRLKLAKTLRCSPSKIERVLTCMEIGQQIGQQKKAHSRLISMVNWEMYQGSNQQNEHLSDNKRTASGQPVDTVLRSKEVKKLEVKNKDKEKYLDFVYLSTMEWSNLMTAYGKEQAAELIRRLNDYIGSKGDKYKSHYFTLLNFARRDNIKKISPVIKKADTPPTPAPLSPEEEKERTRKMNEELLKAGIRIGHKEKVEAAK